MVEPALTAGCLTMGEESMPPTNESSNVIVCDWPCKTVPPLPSSTVEPGSGAGCCPRDMAEGFDESPQKKLCYSLISNNSWLRSMDGFLSSIPPLIAVATYVYYPSTNVDTNIESQIKLMRQSL